MNNFNKLQQKSGDPIKNKQTNNGNYALFRYLIINILHKIKISHFKFCFFNFTNFETALHTAHTLKTDKINKFNKVHHLK